MTFDNLHAQDPNLNISGPHKIMRGTIWLEAPGKFSEKTTHGHTGTGRGRRVYVIQCSDMSVKIGISKDVCKRIRGIEKASGKMVTDWVCTDILMNAKEIEEKALNSFTRTHGEWVSADFGDVVHFVSCCDFVLDTHEQMDRDLKMASDNGKALVAAFVRLCDNSPEDQSKNGIYDIQADGPVGRNEIIMGLMQNLPKMVCRKDVVDIVMKIVDDFSGSIDEMGIVVDALSKNISELTSTASCSKKAKRKPLTSETGETLQ